MFIETLPPQTSSLAGHSRTSLKDSILILYRLGPDLDQKRVFFVPRRTERPVITVPVSLTGLFPAFKPLRSVRAVNLGRSLRMVFMKNQQSSKRFSRSFEILFAVALECKALGGAFSRRFCSLSIRISELDLTD